MGNSRSNNVDINANAETVISHTHNVGSSHNIKAITNTSDNDLHTAAKAGDLVLVQTHVQHGKFDINALGQYGETALYKAARNGHAEVVQLLLGINPEVNIPDVSTNPIYFPSLLHLCHTPYPL